MANRNTFPAAALDRKVVSLYGKVVFGGSGAVASQDCLGFTVTKISATTGAYRCTLEDKWNALLFADAKIDDAATAADVKVQVRNVDLSSTKTVDFQIIGGAIAADATSGHEMYIRLDLLNSNVARVGQ
jgi:hypothetical protein